MEQWRKIDGFPYEVSNLGNVVSLNYNHTGHRQLLKPYCHRDMYLNVVLQNNSYRTKQLVHRLVAFSFVENLDPENFTIVDHIDRNRQNNRADNLRWTNYSGNAFNQAFKGNKLGHQYIRLQNKCKSYRVFIRARGYDKTFGTLAEALEARDNFLKNI
jgi:hypothetical protein